MNTNLKELLTKNLMIVKYDHPAVIQSTGLKINENTNYTVLIDDEEIFLSSFNEKMTITEDQLQLFKPSNTTWEELLKPKKVVKAKDIEEVEITEKSIEE